MFFGGRGWNYGLWWNVGCPVENGVPSNLHVHQLVCCPGVTEQRGSETKLSPSSLHQRKSYRGSKEKYWGVHHHLVVCKWDRDTSLPEPWACNVHTTVSLRHQPALWMLPWQGAEQASEPGGSADGRHPEPTHTCTFQKTQGKSIWPVAITCQLARWAAMIYLPFSGRGHTEPGWVFTHGWMT